MWINSGTCRLKNILHGPKRFSFQFKQVPFRLMQTQLRCQHDGQTNSFWLVEEFSANKEHWFYFNRISHLWNSIPVIDFNLYPSISLKVKSNLNTLPQILTPQTSSSLSLCYCIHNLYHPAPLAQMHSRFLNVSYITK